MRNGAVQAYENSTKENMELSQMPGFPTWSDEQVIQIACVIIRSSEWSLPEFYRKSNVSGGNSIVDIMYTFK